MDSERQRESSSYRRSNVQESSPQVHDVCDVPSPCCTAIDGWGALAAAQALGVGFTNTVGVVTPTFHQVFRPGKLRTIFAKCKRRKLKAPIMLLESIFLKRLQLRKQTREGTRCLCNRLHSEFL